MNKITMHDLNTRLKSLGENETVLDVRGADEFADGHVPGAINIPHDEVARHAERLRKFDRVYIHCRSGKRAQLAFADLTQAGVTNLVCVADGGMLDWAAAGYPVTKGA